jgi:hypothetical protein
VKKLTDYHYFSDSPLPFFEMRGACAPAVFVMFRYSQIFLMPDRKSTGFSGGDCIYFSTPLHGAEQGYTKQRGLSGLLFPIRVVHGKSKGGRGDAEKNIRKTEP